MANPGQVLQQLRDQVQMLTTELAAQRLELDAAKGALDDQQTQTATTAFESQTGKTPSDPFQGTDADWERYKFGFVTCISTVDSTYPGLLKKAGVEKNELATVEMIKADEQLSTNLFFAILVG